MGKKNQPKRRGFSSATLMKYIRMAALASPVIKGVAQYGFSRAAAVDAIKGFTGVNVATGQFNWQHLVEGWTPYVASVAVTYGVPKLAGFIRGLG